MGAYRDQAMTEDEYHAKLLAVTQERDKLRAALNKIRREYRMRYAGYAPDGKYKLVRAFSQASGLTFEESYRIYYDLLSFIRLRLLDRKETILDGIGTFIFKSRGPRIIPERLLPIFKGKHAGESRVIPRTIQKQRTYVRFRTSPKLTQELNDVPHPGDPIPARRIGRKRPKWDYRERAKPDSAVPPVPPSAS